MALINTAKWKNKQFLDPKVFGKMAFVLPGILKKIIQIIVIILAMNFLMWQLNSFLLYITGITSMAYTDTHFSETAVQEPPPHDAIPVVAPPAQIPQVPMVPVVAPLAPAVPVPQPPAIPAQVVAPAAPVAPPAEVPVAPAAPGVTPDPALHLEAAKPPPDALDGEHCSTGCELDYGYQYVIDHDRPSRVIWEDDPECNRYTISFLKEGSQGPRVALASLEGSGNTWSRYIIECLTGIFTGTVYPEPPVLSGSLWGSSENYTHNTTFVVKTHSILVDMFDQGVLILRNPLDAALADFNRRSMGNDNLARVSEEEIYTQQFKDFYDLTVRKSEVLLMIWTMSGKVKHIISYEHMVNTFEAGVTALIRDLGWKIDPGRLQCLLKHSEGLHHRKPNPHKIRLPINDTQVDRLGNFFCRSNRYFIEKGLSIRFDTDQIVEKLGSVYDFDIPQMQGDFRNYPCGVHDDYSQTLEKMKLWELKAMMFGGAKALSQEALEKMHAEIQARHAAEAAGAPAVL